MVGSLADGGHVLKCRTYLGQADLVEMQAIVMERTRLMGPCTNLHSGDIAHRIYSGLRKYEFDDVVPVWEDDSGIAGFGMVWPEDRAFDIVTRVGIPDSEWITIMHEIAELAEDDGRVETDVIGDDVSFTSMLTDMGFNPKSAEYVFARQPLDSPVIVPPYDFTVRSVGLDDAEQLAAVHSGAFGSSWTSDEYATRMGQPGYHVDNELVAVDSDGRFMGFTIMWFDDVNMVGYFEPVGVHRDFHRRGVGSVLLREGMARMQSCGMSTATVWHARSDERAVLFYGSTGFEGLSIVVRWERTALDRVIPVIR